MPLRTTPYTFQLECVQEIESFQGRALVVLTQGLGKTLTSLIYLNNHPEILKALVVCPASVKWVWEGQIRQHLDTRAEVLQSRTPSNWILSSRSRIFIINYDILKDWLPVLKDLKLQLIIADESQYLGSRASKRTKAFKDLSLGIPHILALSGTPLTNRPVELWPTLNIIKPEVWPNFYKFAHNHCQPRFVYGHWTFTGASNIKRLNKSLKKHLLVRRRIQDVLQDLPPRARHIVPLDINNRREYEKAVKDFLGWLREKSPAKAIRAAAAERLVRVGYLLRLAAWGRISGVCEWIDNFLESNGKLLIFAVHHKVLDALEQKYNGMCVRVDGNVIGSKRESCFRQFNEVEDIRLLLGNIEAAGVGWSCTSTSDTAVVEAPWSPGKLDQALSRTHGIGRGVEGRISRGWLFTAHGTIEEKLLEILQRKQRVITSTIDGSAVENDMALHDELIEALEEEEFDKDEQHLF